MVWSLISKKPNRGTSLLALFIDIEEKWREGFREWLERDMFTARLKIGFRACASYNILSSVSDLSSPSSKYLTVYEVDTLGDLYSSPYQNLRKFRDKTDLEFHERFINPHRYTLNWIGPELSGGGKSFSRFLQIDRFRIPEDNIQNFNSWLVDQYFPYCDEESRIERVRRYFSIEGEKLHFLLHEFSDIGLLQDKSWSNMQRDSAWSEVDWFAGMPTVYERVVHAH